MKLDYIGMYYSCEEEYNEAMSAQAEAEGEAMAELERHQETLSKRKIEIDREVSELNIELDNCSVLLRIDEITKKLDSLYEEDKRIDKDLGL